MCRLRIYKASSLAILVATTTRRSGKNVSGTRFLIMRKFWCFRLNNASDARFLNLSGDYFQSYKYFYRPKWTVDADENVVLAESPGGDDDGSGDDIRKIFECAEPVKRQVDTMAKCLLRFVFRFLLAISAFFVIQLYSLFRCVAVCIFQSDRLNA